MNRQWWWGVLIIAIAGAGMWLRLGNLDRRPMHVDEAVNTIIFQDLIEQGRYEYDPIDRHGPALHYLALVFYYAGGAGSFAQTSEFTFRLVPVVCGVGVILLCWLLRSAMGAVAMTASAVLCALSPAMVFYSRYYIHEMLFVLVTFTTIVAAWRYVQRPGIGWAACFGLAFGGMFAVKETSVIAWTAMCAAALPLCFLCCRRAESRSKFRGLNILIAALCAAGVWAVMLSGFFIHPRGLLDSILAFGNFTERATEAHVQEWYYYFKVLGFSKDHHGHIWSEALILVLAVIGVIGAFSGRCMGPVNRDFARFIAIYTLVLVIVFCAIPYKTPWNVLLFLHGMILLAGIGAAVLVEVSKGGMARVMIFAVLLGGLVGVGLVQLGFQTHRVLSMQYEANDCNPYLYAHTVRGAVRIGRLAERLASLHGHQYQMVIQVFGPSDTHWPLPWYLRRFPNVGFYRADDPKSLETVLEQLQPEVPMVITPSAMNAALAKRLEEFGDYQSKIEGLRHDLPLTVFIRRDLWDAYVQTGGASR